MVEERTLVVGIEIGPVSTLEEQLQFQETAEASQLATWPGWKKNKYSIIISVIQHMFVTLSADALQFHFHSHILDI